MLYCANGEGLKAIEAVPVPAECVSAPLSLTVF